MDLKQNEIRVGNWIQKDGKQYKITPLDIFCLGNNHKAIPLTEEWLIKFGFEKGKDCFKLFSYEVGKVGEYLWYLDNGSSVLKDTLKYVHQLQNLYFCLTGEELTIK